MSPRGKYFKKECDNMILEVKSLSDLVLITDDYDIHDEDIISIKVELKKSIDVDFDIEENKNRA